MAPKKRPDPYLKKETLKKKREPKKSRNMHQILTKNKKQPTLHFIVCKVLTKVSTNLVSKRFFFFFFLKTKSSIFFSFEIFFFSYYIITVSPNNQF